MTGLPAVRKVEKGFPAKFLPAAREVVKCLPAFRKVVKCLPAFRKVAGEMFTSI